MPYLNRIGGPYSVILADPPWPERAWGTDETHAADQHYEVQDIRDIPRIMLLAPCWDVAKDAHLYMWVTNTYLPDGLWTMQQLGFKYVTNIAWPKRRISTGQYFRGKHELLLFGVRGSGYSLRSDRRDLTTLLHPTKPVPRKHSRKPDEQYALIEKRSTGTKRLEMFAQVERKGWDAWGDQLFVKSLKAKPPEKSKQQPLLLGG